MEERHVEVHDPYGFIYVTTNLINGKKYLGQKRFDSWNKWKSYLGSGKAFKNAVKKYGKENFSRDIVCVCFSEKELNQTEYDLSVCLNVINDESWYNLEYGGNGCSGYHHTEETKKHLSEVLSGENHPWYGRNHSEESRKKISESHKGMEPANKGTHISEELRQKYIEAQSHRGPVSEETKRKMSESHKNPSEETRKKMSDAQKKRYENPEERIKQSIATSGENNPRYGAHLSEETKQKISEKAKERLKDKSNNSMYGKHLSEEQRNNLSEFAKTRVKGKNPNAKRVVRLLDEKIYDCIIDAAEDNDVCNDTMRKQCRLYKDFMFYDEWIEKQNNLNNNKGEMADGICKAED